MPDDQPSDKGLGQLGSLVPGKEFEKAAADVSREACKSIVRGIAKLFEAQFGTWIAKKEATAEAARTAIQTHAEIDRSRTLTEERRMQELKEIEHQEVQLLAERRFRRLVIEMAREQANFEAIATQSLYITDHDPEGDKAREIDADWMFKFARYAQEISDKDVQELWSRILSSAAIEGKQRLSPAALQAMSLLGSEGAIDFDKFCRVYATFGFYPAYEGAFENEIQSIDLRNLIEVGVIAETNSHKYSFPDFDMQKGDIKARLLYSHSQLALTQRGAQIASAVFGTKEMTLSEEIQENYIRDLISAQQGKIPFKIFPKTADGVALFVAMLTQKPTTPPLIRGSSFVIPDKDKISDRVRRLLEWANEEFLIVFSPYTSAPVANG